MNELLTLITKAVDEKKGENIIVYDFQSVNPFIDYVVLCSASNLRQVHAIAQHVCDKVKEEGLQIRSKEGSKDSRWILIDVDSIVVHVFYQEEREVYQLEKLYADLPQVKTAL